MRLKLESHVSLDNDIWVLDPEARRIAVELLTTDAEMASTSDHPVQRAIGRARVAMTEPALEWLASELRAKTPPQVILFAFNVALAPYIAQLMQEVIPQQDHEFAANAGGQHLAAAIKEFLAE